MALLVDGVLNAAERDRLLRHLASCRDCCEIFVTARELGRGEVVDTSRRKGLVLSSLAASAVLFLAVWLSSGMRRPAHTDQAHKQESASPRVAVAPSEHPRVANLAAPKGSRDSHIKAGAVVNPNAEPLELLTAEEAARPAIKSYGFASRERADGPAIVVESPLQDGEEVAVTSLRIKFISRPGDGIDLATLKVECLKETPIDLTPRLKSYATINGISLEKFRVPEGLYRFRVSVADYQGRLSEKEFTVNVSGGF